MCVPDLRAVELEVDEGRPAGTYTPKLKRCSHGASPRHAARTNKRTAARYDAPAAVAAAEQDSMVDSVAGKALSDKKLQMTQVMQGLIPWDRGTRIHHRSHGDQ